MNGRPRATPAVESSPSDAAVLLQTSRPVFAVPRPLPLDRAIEIAEALTSLHGPGVTLEEINNRFVFFTPGNKCRCLHCRRLLSSFADTDPELNSLEPCPSCDDTECPKASRHANACANPFAAIENFLAAEAIGVAR